MKVGDIGKSDHKSFTHFKLHIDRVVMIWIEIKFVQYSLITPVRALNYDESDAA